MADIPGRPLIGVTGPRRGGKAPCFFVQVALFIAGGRTVHLRPGDDVDIASYDGLVITGGHDIQPTLYEQPSMVETIHDEERDALESHVIDEALSAGLPLLGICRGAQLLNVRLGGSLHQDLASRRKHTSNRRSLLPLKTLLIDKESRLYQLMGGERMRINNLHDQSIDRLGRGLRVSGRDLDGIVQAIEDPTRLFLIGTQWHPEFMLYSRRQRRLFVALVEAAGCFQANMRSSIPSSTK